MIFTSPISLMNIVIAEGFRTDWLYVLNGSFPRFNNLIINFIFECVIIYWITVSLIVRFFAGNSVDRSPWNWKNSACQGRTLFFELCPLMLSFDMVYLHIRMFFVFWSTPPPSLLFSSLPPPPLLTLSKYFFFTYIPEVLFQ